MANHDVVVIGLGEVGQPLFELIQQNHSVIGIDLEPVVTDRGCSILHICYPFSDRFVGITVKYIQQHCPDLTIINSTVAPGTTRTIQRHTGRSVVYSPVRGKHFKMKRDLLHYTKFIGSSDAAAAHKASEHFESLGMKTKVLSSAEAAELAKLTETTYFGLLIAWAQEVERYCIRLDASYDEVVSFYEEVPFLPRVKYEPGFIGGHCVMPNIGILKKMFDSELLDMIVSSNETKSRSDILQAAAGDR